MFENNPLEASYLASKANAVESDTSEKTFEEKLSQANSFFDIMKIIEEADPNKHVIAERARALYGSTNNPHTVVEFLIGELPSQTIAAIGAPRLEDIIKAEPKFN